MMPEYKSKKVQMVLTHFFQQLGTAVIVPRIPFREETLVQCSRVYAADHISCDMIMTSDADMLPLSDYWKPSEGITCYGRDLSDRHQPICYIAMSSEWWREVMDLTGDFQADICRDLKNSKADSPHWTEWWQVDQDLTTSKIDRFHVNNVYRGQARNSHYPIGRIDRGDWERTIQQEERIDAHLFRDGHTEENYNKILALIIQCLNPTKGELEWLIDYRNEYCLL